MTKYSRERIQAVTDALLAPTGVPGVQARTHVFERVIDGLNALISRHRERTAEVLQFPPVMSRALLERQGYHKSFPHLIGCVCSLHGPEPEIRALVSEESSERRWLDGLAATDLVLTPAACYPLYPLVATRGTTPTGGSYFDVTSYCFRRETTCEPGRLQTFRMREYVAIGTPELTDEFRRRWTARAEKIAQQLGLAYRVAAASDPFFGRLGRMMAVSQIENALKFELLIPIHSEEMPTACMSFNYHQDHFGTTWNLRLGSGGVAHTSCVAFGIDRLGLALFANHGLEVSTWPESAREALSL